MARTGSRHSKTLALAPVTWLRFVLLWIKQVSDGKVRSSSVRTSVPSTVSLQWRAPGMSSSGMEPFLLEGSDLTSQGNRSFHIVYGYVEEAGGARLQVAQSVQHAR